MAQDREKPEETIFKAAIQLNDRCERETYVREACGGDPRLFADVEALLQCHDSRGFLDAPVFAPDVRLDEPAVTEGPGTTIGWYKLLEKIGEGGMAVVYMAEQEQPIRRKVALKIIKLGMDTRQVIARFEAERQALALMDHPNIAKVLDAGATETGRPYFVMELVQGVSITQYCDGNNLSTKDRLALFIQVCNAVQHAHQKGIIHRDIKPSNVMVTHHDGKPVPKVIDFGIAKATNQRLTEKTLFTRYAHLIGTPAYMSPEQAELSDLDIDTRTDIYSLGVLLYELLTGTTPFSEEELRKAGYIEMQRVIREQQPVKPSTRIRTAYVAQPPSAGGTRITPGGGGATGLHSTPYQQVRGDLDWIVMKALEKDRARRYETPNSLASDILRHLEHEPVLAHGPGAVYSLRKFLRRHRIHVLAVSAIVVVTVAGGVMLSLWNRDRAQLVEAEGFKHRGILSQAREQYAKADRDAALETIRPVLSGKHVGPEARLLQATILVDNRQSNEAVAILNNLLNEKPEVGGAAHSLLARILWESESLDTETLREIEEHRRQAEALLPETAEAYFLRAMTAVTIKEQLAALDKALELDPAHYESRRLRAFTCYASRKYERLQDDALVMTVIRPRDPLGYSLRAIAWRELGHCPEAIADCDIALGLTAKTDPQYVDLLIRRSETLLRMGEYERIVAEAPPEANAVPTLQYHLFGALTALGEYDKATSLFREIISPGHETRQKLRDWCAKYVFDTLEAKRSWHPADRDPVGAPFLPMIEAEETYRDLCIKGGRRLTTDGFGAAWSPDGKKLAFSLGVRGYSGVAVFNPATKETDLLIVPGKDPKWSSDGRHIAFVRDCALLRPEKLAGVGREDQQRPLRDEEVWLMDSDGTEPRRLARGGRPSWSPDSMHVYYQSRIDDALCSISIGDRSAEPKRVMTCSNRFPSISHDNQHVAFFEDGLLTILDMASQTTIAQCAMPSLAWGNPTWSPTDYEVCLCGNNPYQDRIGLWMYDLDGNTLVRVLNGQIQSASWSPQATGLTFCLGLPYSEIWTSTLDPNVPLAEALGTPQTLEDHYREMVAVCTRRIEAEPSDASNYPQRAQWYHHLHEEAKARADMECYSTITTQRKPSRGVLVSQSRVWWSIECAINGPFQYRLVCSGKERRNGTHVLRIALGQKGRCEMKIFEIPMVVTSLLGIPCLLGFDAPPARADLAFGKPTNLGTPINTSGIDGTPCISDDGLSLYFTSGRTGSYGGIGDIWVATRATRDAPWSTPENLGPVVNSSACEASPSISADGLSLFFCDGARGFSAPRRSGGLGDVDLWVTTRVSQDGDWQRPTNLGATINSTSFDAEPAISSDGLSLYFESERPGGYGGLDIYVASRATTTDPWGSPVNLGSPVNSAASDGGPNISTDGRALFFHKFGGSDWDLWVTTRKNPTDPWGSPIPLGPTVNTIGTLYNAVEARPAICPDGTTLYFCANVPGGLGSYDLWQASVMPVVDFNGDAVVDITDLALLIENWGTDDTLCDIGPYAWGDGKVDIEDLKVFIAEWEKETATAEP